MSASTIWGKKGVESPLTRRVNLRYNIQHMVKLCKRIAVLACFVCVLMCAGGCETIAKIFSPDDQPGSAVGPVYFEPRVRPGVALVVVVGSGATTPPANMQVLVD